MECWGATGGGLSSDDVTGAYGGYAYGNATLTEGQTIYVCVGGSGLYVGDNYQLVNQSGGYNGGGKGGYANRDFSQGFGGGGATHISKVTGTLESIGLSSAQNNVYLVAGGGGGSDDIEGIYKTDDAGGIGGGSKGGNALNSSNGYHTGTGGGSDANTTYTFGRGQDAYSTNDTGGGGGGWYGGLVASQNAGGGGGSGYTNSSLLLSGTYGMVAGATNIPVRNYVSSQTVKVNAGTNSTASYTITNRNWHGYARITLTR